MTAIALFLSRTFARIQGWLIAAGALIAAIAAAYVAGRGKGHKAASDAAAADKARAEAAALNNALDAVKDRNHVEADIARNPSAVADRLRDDWSRD